MNGVLIRILIVAALTAGLAALAEPLTFLKRAEQSCTDDCEKSNSQLSEQQKQCVLKKYCTPKDKWHLKKVVVEKEKHSPRNSVSFLFGLSRTGLQSSDDRRPVVEVRTRHQLDAGLMYQRDFNRSVRGSVGVTVRKSLYLGLGLNF